MNRDDIADIVVPEEKKTSLKSILTIISLIIVVFVVGVALSDMVVDDSQKDELTTDKNDTVMDDPKLTLQETTKKKDSEDESLISNILAEELDKPMEFPVESNKGVRDETVTLKSNESKDENEKTTTQEPTEEIKKETIAEKSETNNEEPAKSTNVAKVEKVEPKTTTQPSKPKTVKRTPTRASGNYYIQAGAFKNAPSKRLLSSIKNNGYRYTTRTSNGVTKLLIGPYQSRASANKVLGRIKDRIVKSAYIVKR